MSVAKDSNASSRPTRAMMMAGPLFEGNPQHGDAVMVANGGEPAALAQDANGFRRAGRALRVGLALAVLLSCGAGWGCEQAELQVVAVTSDPGPDGRYAAGDEITFNVRYSQRVEFPGRRPWMAFELGGERRKARYSGGSGTDTLAFSYTVAAGDRDVNGISAGLDEGVFPEQPGVIHGVCGGAAGFDHHAPGSVDAQRHKVGAASLPYLPRAGHEGGQGFVRLINHGEAADVSVTAFDGAGAEFGPVRVRVEANAAKHFSVRDLEHGNEKKGLAGKLLVDGDIQSPDGDWRLELDVDAGREVEALAYVRHAGAKGISPLVSTMPRRSILDGAYYSRDVFWGGTFNPTTNRRQGTSLRVANPTGAGGRVFLNSLSANGSFSCGPGFETARFHLPAGESRTLSADRLHDDYGMLRPCGDWSPDGFGGKWRVDVGAAHLDLAAMVLALGTGPASSGSIANFSSAPTHRRGGSRVVPLMAHPANEGYGGATGVLRVINHHPFVWATVMISARDAGGTAYGPVELNVPWHYAVQLTAEDLEVGGRKGLEDGLGAPVQGHWTLLLSGPSWSPDLDGWDVEALAFVRREEEVFLSPVHDVAPLWGGAHRVAFFNPAGNGKLRSRLRVVNLGGEEAAVRVAGVDDDGEPGDGEVAFTVPAHGAREVDARSLEEGGDGLDGALGDGRGKWRLQVRSERDIMVMSLLEGPGGRVTDMSPRMMPGN